MDKKAYIAPEMEVMNVETEAMIAQSFVVDEEGQDDVTGNSRGRRGSWGNLWENYSDFSIYKYRRVCRDAWHTFSLLLVRNACAFFLFARLALPLVLLRRPEIRLRLRKMQVNLLFRSVCTNFAS